MSHGRLQPGHRARSARRYRGEEESLDQHPYFGNGQSLGGYAGDQAGGVAPQQVRDMPGRADSWSQAAGASATVAAGSWATSGPDSGEWQQPWAAQHGDDGNWTAEPQWPSTDEWAAADPAGLNHEHGEYDAAEDYDAADGNQPFDLARLVPGRKRASGTAGDEEEPRKFGGAHRVPAPPAALKGRAAVVAVAAGAVVAAGQAGMQSGGQHHATTADVDAAGQVHEIAAQAAVTTQAQAGNPQSPQVLNVAPVADVSQFQDILQHGQEFAATLAAQESAKLRPLFSKFANGTFTSGFGGRWGVQHLGVDVAAPIGTPIYAVEDGEVISAGPASGFGMWVRLKHADGTITVYGHVDTVTVSEGQQVMAGDQIATVGNRGFSTGPHCHFEVWLNGSNKVDPLPWLASRGISLGPERD
ncbi:M23 family metallopeptidase [Nocardia sp. NPDC052254]|uniref:M23 family metallopeptidase n=1 Tax=Nocardia sp. NPDC052254 TaxID=3155681 RepID=UPI00343F85E9